MESFKSTLEEIRNAHFIIHVVDSTARDLSRNMDGRKRARRPGMLGHTDSVVLQQMRSPAFNGGAGDREIQVPGGYYGSARTGEGIEELKRVMAGLYDSILKAKS